MLAKGAAGKRRGDVGIEVGEFPHHLDGLFAPLQPQLRGAAEMGQAQVQLSEGLALGFAFQNFAPGLGGDEVFVEIGLLGRLAVVGDISVSRLQLDDRRLGGDSVAGAIFIPLIFRRVVGMYEVVVQLLFHRGRALGRKNPPESAVGGYPRAGSLGRCTS